MHCQKSGLDKLISAVVRYQLWFEAGLFLNKLFGNFIIIFLFSISAGLDQHRFPALRQCKTLHTILKQHFMTSKTLLVIITVLNLNNAFGQEKIWTKQTKISEVISFEKEIDPKAKFLSQNVSLSKDYYPLADKYQVTNPVIVQREPLEYLPIYAEYYYTPADSILRLASYDWEKNRYGNFFDKQKMWKEESNKFDTYNNEYERIKKVLLTQLGTPTSTDTIAKTVSSDRGNYFTRETLWETNDLHAELNMIFESMTYRVRLTIYWKK